MRGTKETLSGSPVKNQFLSREISRRALNRAAIMGLMGVTTNTVGIKSTDAQPTEIMGTTIDVQINQYLAGGEFMEPNAFTDRLFRPTGGPTILLSPDAQAAVQFELVSLGIAPTPYEIQQYSVGKWAPQLRRIDKSTDLFVVVSDSSRIFTFNGPKVNLIAEGQPPVSVEYQTTNPWYIPKTSWHDALGIVGTDGFRITHQYNPETATWQELETYPSLGTAEQRIKKSLQDFLLDSVEENGQVITNPLGLNPAEVKHPTLAQYIETGKGYEPKSFQILRNSKGEPAFILVTGGEYGLRTDLGNIESTQKAVSRLNEVDPNIIDTLTIQFGLRAFAGDIPPESFIRNPHYSATFDTKRGVIQINENGHENNIRGNMTSLMITLIEESRDMTNDYSNNNRFSSNFGIDKATFVEKWAQEHQKQLTPVEYERFIASAESTIEIYTKSS